MYDLVIIGSGVVGLTQALLLAKQTPLRLAVIDARRPEVKWSELAYDSRVYALTPASQHILEALGAWSLIKARRASPFTHMEVWDSRGGGELIFDHRQLNVPALGYIIEENLLRFALLEKLAACPQVVQLAPVTLTALTEEEGALAVSLKDEEQNKMTIHAKLVVGADGAHSWVREQAKLGVRIQAYQHTALIAQVQIEKSHRQTAKQVFISGSEFPRGPLAFLPLLDSQQGSLVWSTTAEEAERLLNLNENSFQEIVARAFEGV